MDYVSGLLRVTKGHDSIWVVAGRLTKSNHFIPIKTTYTLDRLTELYVQEIVRLHGVTQLIVSNRDNHFILNFWKNLQQALGTKLMFSTSFHPQTNDQSERTI